MIKLDKITEIVLCNCIYSNELSKFIRENQKETKIGQPFTGGDHSNGKLL